MLLRMDLLHSFIFNFEFIFNWRIISSQNCVGFYQISVWISHEYIYVCFLLQLPFHPTPLGCYRAPVWVPWVTRCISLFFMAIISACVCVHLLDLFLCRWTFRSLLSLNYCKQCQDTMLVHLSFQIMVFSRCMLRNEIAGSYDVSIFSVL